ncbi:MAG: acyl-CoA dehydrogenase [Rickettsiales bacterium]|nr:acyl-CoA dehydrogenase [Rickettsiales bacterium]
MIELLTIFASSLPDLGLIVLALSIAFAYCGAPLILYLIICAFYFLKFDFGAVFWISYAAFAIIFSLPFIRSIIVTKLIVAIIKKLGLLPKISETEKIALTSGTVWVDGQLFSGKPDFKWIFSQKYPHLTVAEQSFLDNEVEEVCKMCVDYDVQRLRDLPDNVWQYLKDKKFFGMIIPKEYGGLGFSAYFHSSVIQKLASRSVPLAITAMVPNSLGPAELLMHYGTKEQCDYYLPRLADGRELPCFALTEPTAGSDATSIISSGVLFKDSDGSVKIRLSWNKRYITLGAVATVIGVAFQLRDPDKILSTNEDIGITCALVPHDAPGVRQGRRHDPLSTPFINSPLNGENVVIDLDAIIGGQSGLGKGWKMLMECLAAGRGISLPSTGCGGAKFVARSISAYAAIRQQFGTAIGKFEGVEEVLARIVGRTYTAEALRSFTAGAIDAGSKPAVVTAIAKYHATEIFRQVINDGMDIMGGRAIIRGPRNLLANAYFSTPISITVEGANIMTRSLIHFGQGAIMCHPYAYTEVEALEKNDIKVFDRAFFSHIKHLLRNLTRSIVLSLTRGRIVCTSCLPHERIVKKYQRKLAWASASFALLADIAMARFGGDLKRKEKLNGRFGDVLSALYLSVCILRKFIEDGAKKEDEAVIEYALKEQLGKAQQGFDGIYQNIFSGFGKYILLPFAFWSRFNAFACPATDALGHAIAKNFIKNGEFRDSLTNGIFISSDKNDNLGRLENALKLCEASAGSVDKIKQAIRNKTLPRKRIEDLLDLAREKSIISSNEFKDLQESFAAVLDAMQVDEYSVEEYKKI